MYLTILSPLEQFENFTVFKVKFFCSWWLSSFSFISESVGLTRIVFTTFVLSGIFLSLIIVFLFLSSFLQILTKFNNMILFFEQYFFIIEQIIRDLVIHKNGKIIYYNLLLLLFSLLIILNLIGLIPYTYAYTSYFVTTFSLSTIYFSSLNFTGIFYHGIVLLSLFFPGGTPFIIVPLLIIIEFISFFARMFSLAIRLFANITAGHILLKILSWFMYLLSDLFFISFIGSLLITSLWGLEFFISILQAYVFLILLCIYLQDILQLH